MTSRPKFLKLDELPPVLRDACSSFEEAARAEGYHQDEDGRCYEATSEFVRHLHDLGICKNVPTKDLSFRFVLTEGGFEEPYQPGSEWKPSPRSEKHRELLPYQDNGAFYHVVATVMGYAIDWTASQFEDNLPFPTIWKLSEYPLVF